LTNEKKIKGREDPVKSELEYFDVSESEKED
jgi:hypothetical protein